MRRARNRDMNEIRRKTLKNATVRERKKSHKDREGVRKCMRDENRKDAKE